MVGQLLWREPPDPASSVQVVVSGNGRTEKANEILTRERLLEDVVNGRQASLRAPSARLGCGGGGARVAGERCKAGNQTPRPTATAKDKGVVSF